MKALRAGDYFVTSGEVLFRNWGIEGTGPHRFYNAEVEWTFPPEFAELVWGDGKTTNREIVSLTGDGSAQQPPVPHPVRRGRERSGFASRCGIRPAMARSLSRSTCNDRRVRSLPPAPWN